ncbi:MAG: type VI secretion system contractile sheath small subunit [Rhizobiaceae bacterium]|nr:type VI secretion system contractile sheath small subunit [Rhizobiaceae bacterium]
MARDGSVAPKERINIRFIPATGDQTAEVELPLKTVVLGDFTGRADETPLDQRKAISIDKNSFSSVMKEMDLERTVQVPNALVENDPDARLTATLKFGSLRDFSPDSIAQQVPELRKLVELRDLLTGLKGPLGNVPAFRKALSEIIEDPERRAELLAELEKNSAEEG